MQQVARNGCKSNNPEGGGAVFQSVAPDLISAFTLKILNADELAQVSIFRSGPARNGPGGLSDDRYGGGLGSSKSPLAVVI